MPVLPDQRRRCFRLQELAAHQRADRRPADVAAKPFLEMAVDQAAVVIGLAPAVGGRVGCDQELDVRLDPQSFERKAGQDLGMIEAAESGLERAVRVDQIDRLLLQERLDLGIEGCGRLRIEERI
jgi:hypothetical protein